MLSTGLPIYFLLYLVTGSCGSPDTPPENRTVNAALQDSVVIAGSDQTIRLDREHPSQQVYLKANKKTSIGKNGMVYLLFNGVRSEAAPEGVYEIYLTAEKTAAEKFTPESPSFVNVLDIYLLTSEQNRQRLEINITRRIEKIITGHPETAGYYLTILFKGNIVNGQPSAQAGKLFIRDMRLVQVNSGS